jgi:hypothetical protein
MISRTCSPGSTTDLGPVWIQNCAVIGTSEFYAKLAADVEKRIFSWMKTLNNR